jgi:hypothetical protein
LQLIPSSFEEGIAVVVVLVLVLLLLGIKLSVKKAGLAIGEAIAPARS